MKTRKYALFDLIGTTKAFREATAEEMLSEFWTWTDSWVSQKVRELGRLPIQGTQMNDIPSVYLTILCDSAVLYTEPEHPLDDFYRICTDLREYLLKQAGFKVCCIVNKDEEISPPWPPPSGAYTVGSTNRPTYICATGIGPASANLFYAERAISCHKDWHDKYTLYCIQNSKGTAYTIKDTITTKGFAGRTIELHALIEKTS